jgi:uncharacterized protein GlcG (DUF336 family)
VLDAGGQVRAFEREDRASNARFEIAFGKANGALALGMGSRGLMARVERQPYFIGAVGITAATSDNDKAAAIDAINAAGLLAAGD